MVDMRVKKGKSKEQNIEPVVRDNRATEACFLVAELQNAEGRIPQHAQDHIQRLLDSCSPWSLIASEFTVVKGNPGHIPDPPVNLIRYLKSGQPTGTEIFLLRGIAINWYFELDPRRVRLWDKGTERKMSKEATEKQEKIRAEVWADAEKKVMEMLK
jgi:hypothetical protein